MDKEKTYLAIDFKSYFASCEAADRHLDPLTTNLVVADESRRRIFLPTALTKCSLMLQLTCIPAA